MTATLSQLETALQRSWGRDTAYDANDWSTENPARGQCVVTALVVQDYLDGELLRDAVTAPHVEKHYYNRLPDGSVIDLTSSQYQSDAKRVLSPPSAGTHPSVREKLLSDPSTARRYSLLRERVKATLTQTQNHEGDA